MAPERSAYEGRRRARTVAVKTVADDLEPELVRLVAESLDAGVSAGDRAFAVDHVDQAGSAHEFGQRLRGHLASAVVVRRDLGDGEIRVLECRVDEDHLDARISRAL